MKVPEQECHDGENEQYDDSYKNQIEARLWGDQRHGEG